MYVNEAQNGANKDNPNITGVNYDLVQSIANRCNFGVQLESVDKWGNLLDNGTWTGIVDKLMKKELHLGIADIAITYERASVIDFSIGLMNSDNGLYMREPNEQLQWLTFLEVFSYGFWLCLLASIISLTVFVCFIKSCAYGELTLPAFYFLLTALYNYELLKLNTLGVFQGL